MSGRILIVDDDPTLQILCAEELISNGYETTVVDNGQEACVALRETVFDLIVCDLEMPVMNGLEFVEWLRNCADDAISRLPVIMLTGRDDDEAIQAAFDCGSTSYVCKPVNWLNFCHHVRFVLRSSRNEAKLRAARDIANAESASRENLMMLLRHELRSPLHVLKGFAEVLEKGTDTLPEQTQSSISFMRNAAIEINGHLSKIFNYHDYLNRQDDLHFEALDLHDLLSEIVGGMSEAIARKRITVRNVVARDASAFGDRGAFKVALHQVVENAVKFCREGGVVSLGFSHEENGTSILTIADEGSGFDLDDCHRLLDPFSQGDKGLTRSSTGLGLGISIANLILRQHSGSISLANQLQGEGAVVSLRFPGYSAESGFRLAV